MLYVVLRSQFPVGFRQCQHLSRCNWIVLCELPRYRSDCRRVARNHYRSDLVSVGTYIINFLRIKEKSMDENSFPYMCVGVSNLTNKECPFWVNEHI